MSNKTIWAAWLQGRENAPIHVQRILRLWEELNPDYTVNIIDTSDTQKILARFNINQPRITPQVTTDIARSVLLKEQGGVWVDATLLPTAPLSTWLPPLINPAGFFAFRSSGDPNLVLQNWFLASEMGNPLISKWCDFFVEYFQSTRYWPSWKRAAYHAKPLDYIKFRYNINNRNTLWFADPKQGRNCSFYPYAIHNYNLAYLLNNHPELQNIWNQVPSRWACLPQFIGSEAADRETPTKSFIHAMTDILPLSPVHKLNHRDTRFNQLISIVREQHQLPSG